MKTITRSLYSAALYSSALYSAAYKKQQGAATLMFVLMLPMLLGLMTLGIEGGRYLRLKAQLADAAEVTSLALSARQSIDETANTALAKKYIETLVPGARNITAKVIQKECEDNSACNESQGENFVEYQVEVSATLDSWFPQWGEDGPGFSEEVQLAGTAISRKYQGTTIDVIFVTDFSGSMDKDWETDGKNYGKKIDLLKKVVTDVATEVEKYTASYDDKNTIGLVPFNDYTLQKKKGVLYDVEQKRSSIQKTIDEIFKSKARSSTPYDISDSDEYFFTINLKEKASQITNKLEKMAPGSWTSSYEGIIRGAQIANKGTNPRRLIVVLSDGDDKPSDAADYHEDLLDNNYCDVIRSGLTSQTSNGKPVQARIAVIGFADRYYEPQDNENLTRCAGKENVFSASDPDEIYKLIIGLIDEEVGRLYRRSSIKIPAGT